MSQLEWSTLEVRGPDSRSFLDGQVTQSIPAPGEGAFTGLLQPDGTLVSAGWLRVLDDGADLLVPAATAEASLTRLARFKMRVDCRLNRREGAEDPPLVDERELFERLWPFDRELERGLVPHGCGESFVRATVSFTKGCFVGQELVGRLDARGANVPWRLVRARARSLTDIDEALAVGPSGPQGVTRHREVPDGVEALGVAHRSALGGASRRVTLEVAN